jgi:hypothetical protein
MRLGGAARAAVVGERWIGYCVSAFPSRLWSSQDFVDTLSTAFHSRFEYFRAPASEVTVAPDAIIELLDVFGNVLRRELRTPAHDGHDSGVMADTIPAA